jgi:biotin carboxyl carrier protein
VPRSNDVVSIAAPAMAGLVVTSIAVAEGTLVVPGESLLELEDARGVYDLASPVSGEIVEILVEEDDDVVPSAVLVRIRVTRAKA